MVVVGVYRAAAFVVDCGFPEFAIAAVPAATVLHLCLVCPLEVLVRMV